MKPKTTAITVTDKKPRGRVRGVAVPASPATIAANRVRAWKTGRYARSVSAIEGRAAMLAEKSPDLPVLTEMYLEALDTGDLAGPNAVAALSLAEREVRRREMADKIKEDGVLVADDIIGTDRGGDTIVVGVKWKAHPLLNHEREDSAALGQTAGEMQLTRKSRGEGDKDAAMAAALRRDAALRAAPKEAMAPPPED